MTATYSHAQFFGGPEDGATRLLGPEDLQRGYLEVADGLGNTIRYTIVELETVKNVEDLPVTHELRPTEGVW